jgi:hypothetical protein
VLSLLLTALTPGRDLLTSHHNTRCSQGAVTQLMTSLFITLRHQLHRIHSREICENLLIPLVLFHSQIFRQKILGTTHPHILLVNVLLPLQGSMRHVLLYSTLFSPISPQFVCKAKSEIPSVPFSGSAIIPQVLCRILPDIPSVISGTIRFSLTSSASSIPYFMQMSVKHSLRSRKLSSLFPEACITLRSTLPQVLCGVQSDNASGGL